MDKKEQARIRKQRQRDKEKQNSVTSDSVTLKSVTVPTAYVQGREGRVYESLPERPRYLTLSDGQVLDRTYSPAAIVSGGTIIRMQAANDSGYGFKPVKPGQDITELRKVT